MKEAEKYSVSFDFQSGNGCCNDSNLLMDLC